MDPHLLTFKPTNSTPNRFHKNHSSPQTQGNLTKTPQIQPYRYNSAQLTNNQHYTTKTQPQIYPNGSKLKIRIYQKSFKPISQSNVQPPIERQKETNNETIPRVSYSTLSNQQLLNVISRYEEQLKYLKEYLHTNDLLERQKIVEIFGFKYSCCKGTPTEQCKLVVKQLLERVNQLLTQNHQLKSKIHPSYKSPSNPNEQFLSQQNQKLKNIIHKNKQSQNNQINILKLENQQLYQQVNYYKNLLNQKYRDKQYQSVKGTQNKYQSSSRVQQHYHNGKNSTIKKQPIFTTSNKKQQTSIKSTYNMSDPNRDSLEYAKKSITEQMFLFEQQTNQKQKIILQRVTELTKRIQQIQAKIRAQENKPLQYQFRNDDNELKKHFSPTKNIKKLSGDQNTYQEPNQLNLSVHQSNLSSKQQQGQINSIMQSNYQNHQNFTKMNNECQLPLQLNPKYQQLEQQNKKKSQQLRKLKQKLLQQQQELDNQIKTNKVLEDTIKKLEESLQGISDRKQKEIGLQELEKQIKQIKQSLKECSNNNFQKLFNDFILILKQRNQLIEIMESSKSNKYSPTSKKQNQQLLESLMKKFDELTQQNKVLNQKILELQTEVENYQNQIGKSQNQYFNQIDLNQFNKPAGFSPQQIEDAEKTQKNVQNCIENNINRLEQLQKKFQNFEKKMQNQNIN